MAKYFSYSNDHGIEFHDTEKEAIAAASDNIGDHLGDGWDDEVTTCIWGEVKQQATQCNVRPDETGQYAYICDYDLKDVE